MERRGGCCIARCSVGGAGAGAYNMQKVDRIMLRFRPIAPKPPTAGSVSGGSSPDTADSRVKTGRCKRKYVRDKNNNNKKCNSRKRKEAYPVGDPVVTLPLLPETPEPKEKKQAKNAPIWLSFNGGEEKKDNRGEICKAAAAAYPDPPTVVKRVVGSYVTVECVTETWVEGDGMTNEERMMNLEKDTCPGMITDGQNRVVWANKAYREMVGQVEGGDEMMVWVLMKQWVSLPVTCPAFTCRVSWVTCSRKGKNKPLTLPCDVWKMNGVGFAWRLDVKAALCLGL